MSTLKLHKLGPKPKLDIKKISMHLRCILNDEEKLAAGRALADAGEAITRLEADLDSIKVDFKGKISAQESIIGTEQSKIRSGYEVRDVPCEVTYDEPKKGQRTIRRMDTKETHEVQAMSGDELQRTLALEMTTTGPITPAAGAATSPVIEDQAAGDGEE